VRFPKVVRGVVVFWLCACASSCASQPLDEAIGFQTPATPTEFVQEFAAGVCEGIGQCCGLQGLAFDAVACRASITAEIAPEIAHSEALQVEWDADAALRCIQDYSTAICGQRQATQIDVKKNCILMFRGRVAAGQACKEDAECNAASGETARCDVGGTDLCEVHALPAHGKRSEPCSGTCIIEGNSFCDLGLSGQNTAPGADMLPRCQTSDGLQCSPDPDLGWSCQPLLAIGESCANDVVGCSPGAFCSFETLVCEAQLPAGAGPCADIGDACLPPAICDVQADECVAPKRNGEPCRSDAYCQSSYCNLAGLCARPELPEAMCANPSLFGN
jgi:hypothetical protein